MDLKRAVDGIEDQDIHKFLSLCLKSRPRFIAGVVDVIRDFLKENSEPFRSRVGPLIEDMRNKMAMIMRDKEGSLAVKGCYGYVVAMMSAGFCLEDKNEGVRKLIATFSTKNWAYLVNDKALIEA